jgi:capsid protein
MKKKSILSRILGRDKEVPVQEVPVEKVAPISDARPRSDASFGMGNWFGGTPAFTAPWNGQNALGEMGDPVNLIVDHGALAIRSWQLYLESTNYKTILKRLKDTVVGSGLSLQSNPNVRYLKKKGIDIDAEAFTADLEDVWDLFANTTMADYADKDTLGEIHARAYLNSIAAGDVLVILRPINNVVKTQLVDGVHVQTPINFGYASESKINYSYIERINPDTGNRVRWGIEIDATGKHVAYFVRVGMGLEYVRVLARGPKSGAVMAYMLTDEEFKIDNLRSLPRLASGMETASQLSRYQSAMVSAAEEISKSPYYIKHELNAEGVDPRMADIKSAHDIDRPGGSGQLNYDAEGNAVANKVMASTNRTVTNMPPGSELRALDSKNQMHYEPFN